MGNNKKGAPRPGRRPNNNHRANVGCTGQATAKPRACPVRVAIGRCVRATSGRLDDVEQARRAWARVVRPDSELAERIDKAARLTSRGEHYGSAREAPAARLWRVRALALIAAQASRPAAGCKGEGAQGGGRSLWAGRDRVGEPDEQGRYTRASGDPRKLGGLASRLGCAVRTVGRLWHLLGVLGVCGSWQPRAQGGAAPESLPRQLVGGLRDGVRYAYRVIRWAVPLPRELAAQVHESREKAALAEPVDAGPGDRQPTGEGAAVAAQFLAMVQAH